MALRTRVVDPSAVLAHCTAEDRVGPVDYSPLLRRASLLADQDRALVNIVTGAAAPVRQVARLLGVSAGTVSRRLKRLRRLLSDPVAAALLDWPEELPAEYRRAAIDHFLRRQPVSRLAASLGQSRYQVQRMLDYVRGWSRRSRRRLARERGLPEPEVDSGVDHGR